MMLHDRLSDLFLFFKIHLHLNSTDCNSRALFDGLSSKEGVKTCKSHEFDFNLPIFEVTVPMGYHPFALLEVLTYHSHVLKQINFFFNVSYGKLSLQSLQGFNSLDNERLIFIVMTILLLSTFN